MRITIVTPAGANSRHGNRNTAVRWSVLLRSLGHQVSVQVAWNGSDVGTMIALHARRSHDSIRRFSVACPDKPLILALTGTDVYRDIHVDSNAQQSMSLATRMIVLQESALKELTPTLRRKTSVIYQSAPVIPRTPPLKSCFEILVSGHLREEKDPFRTVAAMRYLPDQSRIRVTHIGGAMSLDMQRTAEKWMQREPRYRWLGEVSHGRAARMLARARLMVISSRMEGGANVVSEALALRTPVIASHISGNIGMLGARYAGYYPLEDERALSRLLWRAESNRDYLNRLREQCRQRRTLISESSERQALRRLLAEVS